jgi:hypothetical protein
MWNVAVSKWVVVVVVKMNFNYLGLAKYVLGLGEHPWLCVWCEETYPLILQLIFSSGAYLAPGLTSLFPGVWKLGGWVMCVSLSQDQLLVSSLVLTC